MVESIFSEVEACMQFSQGLFQHFYLDQLFFTTFLDDVFRLY